MMNFPFFKDGSLKLSILDVLPAPLLDGEQILALIIDIFVLYLPLTLLLAQATISPSEISFPFVVESPFKMDTT